MLAKQLLLATSLALVPAGAAFAQSASSQPSTEQTTPPATAPDTTAPTAPGAADTPAPAPSPAASEQTADKAPATAAVTRADVKAGATVFDSAGVALGKVQSVTATGAVVAVGKQRAEVPLASLAKSERGLTLSVTKAEFEAALSRAKS